ncbi:hypothetical protein ACTTPN_002955 [Escherichia coli]|nr:hypothetical protein [Escherichia coli]HAX2987317.1 hypothetical protein [Escherichia coli]
MQDFKSWLNKQVVLCSVLWQEEVSFSTNTESAVVTGNVRVSNGDFLQ